MIYWRMVALVNFNIQSFMVQKKLQYESAEAFAVIRPSRRCRGPSTSSSADTLILHFTRFPGSTAVNNRRVVGWGGWGGLDVCFVAFSRGIAR
jgi:hypothetical protein